MRTSEHDHPYVVVAGPPGVGKSTAGRIIADRLRYIFYPELTDNPFLANSTKDPARWTFQTETYFLMVKIGQIISAQGKRKTHGIVGDTPVLQDVLGYARAKLEGPEWDLFYNMYETVTEAKGIRDMKPSLVVCLEASTSVNMQRIRQRGRDFEKAYTARYVARVADLNRDWIISSGIPALFVNTDSLNFIKSAPAQDHLVDLVRQKLRSNHE